MTEKLLENILVPRYIVKELNDIYSSTDLGNLVKRRLNEFKIKVNGEQYVGKKLLFAQEDNSHLFITNKIIDTDQLGLYASVEDDNVMTAKILIKNYKANFYILSSGEVSFTPISRGCTILNDRDFSFYRIQRGVPEAWLQKPQAFPFGVPVPA